MKTFAADLRDGAKVVLIGDCPWLRDSALPLADHGALRITTADHAMTGDGRHLIYHRQDLALGVGCERGVDGDEIIDLITRTLRAENLSPLSLAGIFSLDLKTDEAGIHAAAAYFHIPARFFDLPTLQAEEDRLATPLTISGSIIGIANYQVSNRDSKFGYLMRNPTSANQIGDHVSEALIHSAQLGFTANFSDWLTGYAEILYNPQQNFGPGTIAGRDRNQLLMQRAYLMIGDLERSPVFGVVGKVDIPFGLNDTVSPFTNSTSWHSFAGLAYGAQLGYVDENLMIRAMAIQGGAQFRAANAPVEGTVVPSRINNFAVDANYTFNFNEADWMMLGASYQHGSAYCQNYPIFHFNPCDDNNPAWAAYAQGSIGNLELLGEFAETTDVWPGSAVPIPTNPLSVFDAQKTRSWTVGGRYGFGDTLLSGKRDHYISLEFSKFRAGEEGAPWERQNQFMLGYSRYLIDNVNIFAEAIHVDGFAPLNFLTGGNFPDGSTWSDNDAKTEVILIGAHTAF
jgi:hypothetical protein